MSHQASGAKVTRSRPFVKWAGGKRQLLNVLAVNVPEKYDTYIEPFVGGGALMFELLPKQAIISDINAELINAYLVIRNNVDKLIRSLARKNNKEVFFYKERAKDTSLMDKVQRASRFIYLNKTCYNGLYRENSRGEFNVPFGDYQNPAILDRENLLNISAYLNSSDVRIYHQDYKQTVLLAKSNDFVYLDPPYHPLTATSSFTKYSKGDFSDNDQIELSEVFTALNEKGCHVMLSNSNTEFIKDLYRGYNIQEIEANRAINCKGDKRGRGLFEVLIKNWS
ncbi:MAG: DNA adenine methylase [Nitrospirae bacterium]|nr:DNA adenine methylase [Nitrospirota bacterium]